MKFMQICLLVIVGMAALASATEETPEKHSGGVKEKRHLLPVAYSPAVVRVHSVLAPPPALAYHPVSVPYSYSVSSYGYHQVHPSYSYAYLG